MSVCIIAAQAVMLPIAILVGRKADVTHPRASRQQLHSGSHWVRRLPACLPRTSRQS
jgi:hypothetical protein